MVDVDERAARGSVEPPKNTLQYQQYFCAKEPGGVDQLKANEPKRVELYKAVAAVVRKYGALANDMSAAGYSDEQAEAIRAEVAHYADVRDEVKLGAGEDIDFKQYEAGMRHLLDTYISATPSEVLADFDDATLIQLIVQNDPVDPRALALQAFRDSQIGAEELGVVREFTAFTDSGIERLFRLRPPRSVRLQDIAPTLRQRDERGSLAPVEGRDGDD